MTHEEKRSQMLCHRCWLVGGKNLAIKMIGKQGSLLIKGYEDALFKEIWLGICHACLVSSGLAREIDGKSSYGEQ
jgi:hypothetical protein